ncbi:MULTISPECIES: hypothetical protein [unclassified Bradyrhizobium]|uniref:hypothetical protein n=1 Tax=unclassified Bradyrhizobium TaxID=2631580 RepID=UPI002916EEB2|nr:MULTISPECIES: hypothetical protein [unclassified Bradyrhizobium]
MPNHDESAETHPDFRVFTQGVEIGAAMPSMARTAARTMRACRRRGGDGSEASSLHRPWQCFRPRRGQCVCIDL